MAYNPFIELDDAEISKLGFEFKEHPYLYYSETTGKNLGTIYSVDDKIYKTIIKILEGDSNNTISKKDKVFFTPGCKLPQFRIKEYLKSIKATMTRDMSKATIVVGTDDIAESVQHGTNDYKQARLGRLLFEDDTLWRVDDLDNFSDDDIETLHQDIRNEIGGYISDKLTDDQLLNLRMSNAYRNETSWSDIFVKDSEYYLYIYPITLKIIYEVLANKLPIIHEDDFCSIANSGMKLNDQETFNSILLMLDSQDSKDKSMAVEMLCNCDFSDATYELWKIATKHSHIQYINNSKNLKYFLNESNFWKLGLMNESEFISYLKEDNELTKDLFGKFLPDFMNSAFVEWENNTHMEKFFDITLTLKDNWKDYSYKKDHITKKTKEHEME